MQLPAQSLPDPLPVDPMPLAAAWLRDATDGNIQRNPNSMALATTDAGGRPSVRVVLCKEIVIEPGYLVFYTNYESRKGRELAAKPWAAVVFHWDAMGRQLRVEGPVVRSPASESDDYFASRPWQSRLAALTSRTPARDCRAHRAGADIAFGRQRSNYGSRVNTACMIESAGPAN